MSNIIQALKDAQAEKDTAKIINTLLPELFQAEEDGLIIEAPHAHWAEKTTPWNMGCEKYLVCSKCGSRQAETYGENGNKHCDVCGALMGKEKDNAEIH